MDWVTELPDEGDGMVRLALCCDTTKPHSVTELPNAAKLPVSEAPPSFTAASTR